MVPPEADANVKDRFHREDDMESTQNFIIAGSGKAFPSREVSAEDIDQRTGMPAGWTRNNVGVLRRFECTPEDSLGSMAREAITHAMNNAGVQWSDIDLIMDCSTSRHRPIPCNAAHIQALFGESALGVACFDVQSTCLGFIVAMNVANALMRAGTYRHILIVCVEGPTRALNWQHPESAALFGDGAAAFVVRRREEPGEEVCLYCHETYSTWLETCKVDGGGHHLSPYDYTPEIDAKYRFHMDGPKAFQAAKIHMPQMVRRILESPRIAPDHLQVIPHQASPKAMTLFRRHLGFKKKQCHGDIENHGNLVAAGIPVTLHQAMADGRIVQGQQVMLLGSSAGYSQAAMVFQV